MALKNKNSSGWNLATPHTSYTKQLFTILFSRIIALIITLALWGLLPVGLADWIIHLGDIRDE